MRPVFKADETILWCAHHLRAHWLAPAGSMGSGVRTNIGMSREVRARYSGKSGQIASHTGHRPSLSARATSAARIVVTTAPSWTSTTGLARRLWYHAGLAGAPP